jgi:PAS domain S-box-containing protein
VSFLAQAKKLLPKVPSEKKQSLDSRAAELEASLKNLDVSRLETSTHSPHQYDAIAQHLQELDESRRAVLNLLEDLTEAKAQVEAARAYDEALLASIADAVIAINRQGDITTANPAVAAIFGYTPEELIGKKVWDFFLLATEEGSIVPLEDHPLQKTLRASVYSVLTDDTHYMRRRDGTLFPISADVTPVMDDGKVIGAIAVIRDTTAEHITERAKTEFVTLASHQLRTPLTTLIWHAELLLGPEAGVLTEVQRDYADKILSSGRRMLELIDMLLDVSRIEMGILAVQLGDIDMAALAREVLGDITADVVRKNLSVRVDDHTEQRTFHGDSALMRIIMQNLFVNAVKYTPSGGSIAVDLAFSGNQMVLKVSDTGIGIPEEAQPRIYDKLFRADNARKIDPIGSGLGLYMVKSIVAGTGGEMSYVSREGEGTTFTVSYPAAGMTERGDGLVMQS